MNYDDIRKRYGLGSSDDESDKKEENSTQSSTSPYDEIRKRYGITSPRIPSQGNTSDNKEEEKTPTFDYETGKKGWQKYLDDQSSAEQKKAKEKEDEKWWETLGRYLGSTGATDTTLSLGNTGQIINDVRNDTSYQRPSDDWSEEQQYQFGALYLESPGKAYSYAEKINNANNKAKEEAEINKIQDSATSNGWVGAAHTAGAIASAGLGMADYLNMLVLSNAGRDPLESDGVVSPFEYSTAVTEGIGTHLNETYGTLDEDIPIFGGKGWGDVYGLGTSIAQSFISGHTLGPAGILVSYFGQGAASGMKDALERGASEWQAARYGAALGAFEGVAESIGIDNLFKLGSSSTIKGLLKNILQQAKAEGLEEGFTSVLSNIADAWIMQDKSNFNVMLNAYMEAGMSEKNAKWAVFWDSLEGIAFDMIAGAASGGIHGGLQTGIQTGKYSSYVKNAFGGQVEDLLIEAGQAATDETGDAVDKYIDKYGEKGKLSGMNIAHLLEITDTAKVKSAAKTRLTQLGEKGNISQLVDILTKQAQGMALTKAERTILENSQFGRSVSEELSPSRLASEEDMNRWAESIGTRTINPYEYNKGRNVLAEDFQNKIVTKGVPEKEITTEAEFEASEEGDATLDDTISIMNNMVEKMELSDDVAGQMLEHFKPSDVQQAKLYQHAVPLAYNYGKIGYSAGLRYITSLSEQDKNYAYRRGAIDALIEADSKQSQIESAKTGSAQGTTKKKGIIYEGGYEYKEKTATPLQKSSMKAIEVINAISNLEIHVFESVEENGKRVYNLNGEKVNAPNGYFKDGNKIYIDINAGQHGEGLMLDTLGHEVTHYIRENDAKGFKAIADFLIEQYGKKGVNVEALLEGQRKKIRDRYAREGVALPSEAKINDMAYEELVADAMSEMFNDPKAVEKLSKLKQENRNAWETLRDAIKNILDKIKSILDQYKSEKRKVAKDAVAREAYEVRNFSADVYDKLQDLYIKAFVEADANYEAANSDSRDVVDLIKDGDFYKIRGEAAVRMSKELDLILTQETIDGKNVPMVGFPLRYLDKFSKMAAKKGITLQSDANFVEEYLNKTDILYNQRFEEDHKKKLEKEYSKDASIDLDTLIRRYNKILNIWKSLGGELNSKFLEEWNNKLGKDRAFTVFKAQAGYKYNVELSSMCKKGVPLFEAIDTIVKNEVMKQLNTDVLGKAEKEILYDILKSHNFEIPCAICYVEQARQREGAIIDAFLNGKIEKNKSGKITQYKLGWNEVLQEVQKEMQANGVDYTFAQVDRSISTDRYVPVDTTMDAATQEAFYNALKKVANKEIKRYNKAEGKNRKLVTTVTPSAIKDVFKGTLPSNLKIFKVLFSDPSSRFTLESDLLYSSMTTTNLAMAHNELYSLFNSQGGVSGYKTKQGTVVYWGDILGKTWEPAKVRDEGGIRNQSNSDFQMYTLLDQAQMYIDFSAKGYYLQAYTKVLSELKLFGLSRGKINASLIPAVHVYYNKDGSIDIETTRAYAGLDKNGNLFFDDIEGINHNEAFMLLEDAEYSKSIGGICIGYSDEHILKLLDDKRVQQIIGFHDKTDDPDKRYRGARYAKNYNGLNEAINNKDGKTVHIGFNPYVKKAEKMFKFNSDTETYEGKIVYNDKTYVADDIPKLAADLYLEMCREKDYTPAYTDFDFHENYYKLLADFSLYDSEGHYAPHRKVAYNMPDSVPYLDINGKKKYMPTKDYIKAELEKELKVRDAIAEALADESENGIIPQFVKKVNEAKSEAKFSDRDSEGNELSTEQIGFFKDSKARDKKGNLLVLYHGTTANFNTFKKGDIGFHFGTKGAARGRVGFGKNVTLKEVYLNITNPIVFDEDLGSWDADFRLAQELYEKGILTMDELRTVLISDDGTYRRSTESANKKLASVLITKGYDGISYQNTFETKKATTSYIVFNSNQAKEITNKTPTASPDIRYSDREIQPITEEEYQTLEKHFGVTGNFRVAGYLLPNGKLLDFSGKHWGDTTSRSRQVDHRDVNEVLDRGNNGYSSMVDMIGSGNIRLMPETGGINLAVYPNEKQRRVLSIYIKQMLATEGQVIVDYDAVGGDTVYSRVYEKYASSEQILRDIRNYFNGARQSDLMQFHTMYSDRDFPSNAEDIAKEYFGITTKWAETGWLLKDGTQLDFSGRHWERYPELEIELGEAYYRGKRNVEHFEIVEAFPELRDFSGMEYRGDNLNGFLQRGNIRIVGNHGIDLLTMPTDEQFEKLRSYFRENTDKYIVIGIGTNSLNFREGTNASIKIEAIRDYFLKGKDRRSDLMRFHNEYYSDRDTETVSNRTLLANALDSVAKNDIEKNRLNQYKSKIALIEAEQARLAKIRAELRELYFTKGRRDTDKIKSLQTTATQIENRINKYDRQLLNLESTEALKDVLQREKKMAYKQAEQRGKESLRRQKEKDAATVRELMTRNYESRKKATESRNKTAMRAKIKKVVSELNQLLLHGSKERNVKLGLQEAVAAALDAINMDTVGADERIAKYNALIAKATDEDVIASLVETRDRIKAQGDSLGDKLKAMKEAYYAIQHGEESKNYPAYFKDEATLIEQRIQNVIDKVGNTSLRNMSLAQLDLVYDMYKMVLTTIRNANNVWKEGKALDLQENASAVMTELEAIKELGEEGTKIGEHIRSYSWNEMTPYYAFDRIGSKTFKSFFMETIKGQNVYARDVAEAKAFADKTRKKYGYTKWDLDKVYEFKLKDTRKFQVTLKHMLSIYAYSKRDQALPHMSTGGFFFNDKSTFRKKGGIIELIRRTDSGYKIDAEILAEIKEALGDKVNYVDEMQDYLTKMGEKGNEVTRTLWGIDLFKEKVYFPLKSMSDFIKKSTETAQSVSLKNDGMTKETVPVASNPIVLEAFDDVWASHIDRMSQYHAFVIPIDNLNKIHQYGTWAGTESMAVSTMLTGRFGSAVNEYITQFIKDLNGNVVNPGAKNPLMGFLSKFKKTAVGASLSTVVQQPTAVLRAMADINAKYFIGKPNTKKLSNQWEELKQYAPIAIIKDIGGFDAGSGVQVSNWLNSDTLRGVDKVMNTIDDISMKGAEIADQLGWTSIWEAVKREISATTNLKAGSEEFLKKAGERFTEVIVRTQVYDSTLSRSGFMRSKSDTMKMLTAFMGEPTLSMNMMFNAIINAKRGGSKKQAVRTIGFTYASIIAASALSSLIYALRDDDDDESYLEKYMESLGGEFISDVVLAPVTSLPAVKDIVSIFQGWDVERTDVAIFKDIKDAFDGLSSETKSPYRKVEDFAGAIASAFGLPLKNVLRTGREIYNAFSAITDDISGGDAGGAFIEGITGKGQSKPSQLYKAIINGDDARLERIKSSYKDESSYLNAVKTALRENDSRIHEAAQARLDGNISEYTRIAREIIAEGHFSQDTVVAAINSEMSAIKKGESTQTESTDSKDEVTSIYRADDINVAFDNGDTSLALSIIDELVEMKMANGMDEKKAKSSLRSSMTSYWKPLYKQAYASGNTAEMQRIKQILYKSGLYGSATEVIKDVNSWLKN